LQWTENKPNHQQHLLKSFYESGHQFKRLEVIFLGIVDALYQASEQILIFIWTPVLQYTAGTKHINTGAIFIIMICSLVIQNRMLEILNRTMKINHFKLAIAWTFLIAINFMLIYFVDSFELRIMILTALNGTTGFFHPLLSYIRSLVLPEKYRAYLMNMYRVPLNVILITVYIVNYYVSPFTICLVVGIIMLFACISSIVLNILHKDKDDHK
jgi:hypothetical protein